MDEKEFDDFEQDDVNDASSFAGSTSSRNTGEEEVGLPKSTLNRLIQEMMPTGVICSKETKDLLMECCVEFIHLISSEANEICEKGKRRTISPEHIIEALKTLGFENYTEEVESAYTEHRTQVQTREKSLGTKLESTGMTQEELMQQQQQLFEQARLKFQQQQIQQQTSNTNANAASSESKQ